MLQFKRYDFKKYDVFLLLLVIIISGIGLYLIKLVDDSDPSLSVYKKQVFGIIVGLFTAVVVSLIDYHFISRFMWPLYVINIILLILVRLVGVESHGARRWLNIGIQFQPSEISKIIMIIFMANFFTHYQEKINKLSTILLSILLMGIPTGLILIQTNLSTSIVMAFIFVMLLFAAGLSYKIILPIIAVVAPLSIGIFWYIQQPYQKIIAEYQQDRVLAFLNPELYGSSIMYQQNNSVQAIGSGRLYGKMLEQGVESASNKTYVAEAHTDFIFTVIGEEFGFLGCCVIIGLLALVVIKCILIARKAKDQTGMLIAVGVASMMMFQVFVNIGVNTSILPNTGLTLPFVSYGLSSLISNMMGIGLVLNIGIQRKLYRG